MKFILILFVFIFCIFESTYQQSLQNVANFSKVLNNVTMTLAGKLSVTTNNILYYDSVSPEQRNQSLYTYDLKTQQKTRINQSYFSSSFYDLKGGAKQRLIITAQQIPDWTFRTLRFIVYNRVDLSYITYAYNTLEMQAILDMAAFFDSSNNLTSKDQFKIGVVTNKGNLCGYTLNYTSKTSTDKYCVKAHAYNATCIISAQNNQQFITGGQDSAIRVWNRDKVVFSWLQTKPITALHLSKNKILWNGDSVGTIRAYNLTSYFPYKVNNLTENKGKILSLSINNQSKYLASCSDDGSIILWSAQTGKVIQKIKFQKVNTPLKIGFFQSNFNPSKIVQQIQQQQQMNKQVGGGDVDIKQYLYSSHADGSIKFWSISANSEQIQQVINLSTQSRKIQTKISRFIETFNKLKKQSAKIFKA